ncbi:cytochrome P450 2J5-like [Octopus sinensis]|nr:cytochrome P450 2J5-like [Octopus sinensis]
MYNTTVSPANHQRVVAGVDHSSSPAPNIAFIASIVSSSAAAAQTSMEPLVENSQMQSTFPTPPDLTTLIIFLGTLGLLLSVWKQRLEGLPPGPPRIPIVGSTVLFSSSDLAEVLAQLRKRYGDIFSLHVGNKMLIFLNGYNNFKEAFITNPDLFTNKASTFITEKLGQGKGIVCTNGLTWREQRKLTLRVLKDLGLGQHSMEDRMHEEVTAFVKALDSNVNTPFDAHDLVQTAVANVICSLMFGRRFDYDNPQFKKYVHGIDENFKNIGLSAIVNFFPMLEHLPGDPFKFKKIFKNIENMEEFLSTAVTDHMREYEETNIKDFIDAYIKEMKQREKTDPDTSLNEEQLCKVIGDLLIAGTETTTSTILWALVYMLHYPDVQKRIQAEIDENVEHDRLPSLNDRSRLPYLDASVMEIQRRGNVVQLLLGRQTPKDITFGGYTIPKEAIIIPNLGSVMTDKEIWGDPENFRPERFLSETKGKNETPSAFIPFFVGKRSCLGEPLAKSELFLFLSGMLQQFTFTCAAGDELPPLKGVFGITNMPHPFRIQINRRQR